MVSLLLLEIVTALSIGLCYVLIFSGRRGRGLPPGPPTLPLIGNLHQLPKSGAHFRFSEWAQKYGGIFSLKLGSATAVVLTDRKLVKALLDRKSSVYSNRPASYVSHHLITRGDHTLVMNQGDKWRTFRKLIHQHFQESRCQKQHIGLQNAEAVQMMRDFLVAPSDLMQHPKRFSNSIVMSLLFGIRSPTVNAPHLVQLYELMEEWSKVMEAGATPPVDIFPLLKLLPESIFNHWRTRCRNVGKAMDTLYGRMVSRVLTRRLQSGTSESFLDVVLDQQDKLQLSRHELNFLCGVLMEGGSDTSSSIILAFIQAMIKFPTVQKRAQQEIDAVMGEDRSPMWCDFANLPYINMVVKETMRWRPVTPLAFPHATSQADMIDGFHIPAKSTVFLNTYGLHHDPLTVPSPAIFDPTRHSSIALRSAADLAISPSYNERDHYGYGSGRRICPGIHLAERNLWLAMAKLLWAFEFREVDGKPIDADYRTGYCEGFLCCAKPFEADVRVRGKRKETIEREFTREDSEVLARYESG